MLLPEVFWTNLECSREWRIPVTWSTEAPRVVAMVEGGNEMPTTLAHRSI